jgi:hypothetical protein
MAGSGSGRSACSYSSSEHLVGGRQDRCWVTYLPWWPTERASVQGPTSLGSAARKRSAVAAQACVNAATTAPSQQMQGTACAKRRSRRSRSTVGAEVMLSSCSCMSLLRLWGWRIGVRPLATVPHTRWTEATGRAALRQGDIQPRVGDQPSRDSSVRLRGPTNGSPLSWAVQFGWAWVCACDRKHSRLVTVDTDERPDQRQHGGLEQVGSDQR